MSMWFYAGLSALVPLIGLELHCIYLVNIVDNVFRIPVIFLVLACYTRIYFLRASLYRYITTSEERQPEGQSLTESARRIKKLKRKERSVARTVFILVVIPYLLS